MYRIDLDFDYLTMLRCLCRQTQEGLGGGRGGGRGGYGRGAARGGGSGGGGGLFIPLILLCITDFLSFKFSLSHYLLTKLLSLC